MAALAPVALAAAPAAAAPSPAPQPSSFGLTAVNSGGAMLLHGRPGQTLGAAVEVRNFLGHPISVRLQAADIGTAANGNADYITTNLHDTGRWVQLSGTTVDLPAHASRQVSFRVEVPGQAQGASHYAGIVAFNAADLHTAALRRASRGRMFNFYRVNREALPITVRLPGVLTRRLSLGAVKLAVQPGGAGLVLALQPGGSDLIAGARVSVRALLGNQTVFHYASTLGQLFPGSVLNYSIPWKGRPTPGTYRVIGTIQPQGLPAIHIDTAVPFSTDDQARLTRELPPGPAQPSVVPSWLLPALVVAALLLMVMFLGGMAQARRPKPVEGFWL